MCAKFGDLPLLIAAGQKAGDDGCIDRGIGACVEAVTDGADDQPDHVYDAKPDQSGIGSFDEVIDGDAQEKWAEQVAGGFDEKEKIGESQPVSVLQDQLAQGGKA